MNRAWVRPVLLVWFAALAWMVPACGTDEAVDARIVLAPDRERNSEKEIAELLTTIEWLFDAPDGFSGLGAGDTAPEGFILVDPDEDGQSELLLRMDVEGRSSLPVVGLDAGNNRNRTIAVRVRGLDAMGKPVAYGGTEPRFLFGAGQNRVEVPFNLARWHLAPRIVGVAPHSLPAGLDLATLAFYLSTPMDPASLAEHVFVHLVPTGAGSEINVDGHLEGPLECPYGTEMWTFVPDSCHQTHFLTALHLIITPGATDTRGRPLPEVSIEIPVDQMKKFGPCNPRNRCDELGTGSATRTDIRCVLATGRFEPAPCSVDTAGCQTDQGVFDWVRAPDEAACQAYRPGTIHRDDFCVVPDPWPCLSVTACTGISNTCDDVSDQCSPDACTDSCAQDGLTCVSETGCLPRVGGCAEDCQQYGSCPHFEQSCTPVPGGSTCH